MSRVQLALGIGERWATISPDGVYRYDLGERWDPTGWLVSFCLLNPSDATAELDDPTKVRCRVRAERMGAGGYVITNPYAFRSPHPKVLRAEVKAGRDAVGPENDRFILRWAGDARLCIVGWGTAGGDKVLRSRIHAVAAQLRGAGVQLHALRLTESGQPEHPLFIPYDAKPQPWALPEAGGVA